MNPKEFRPRVQPLLSKPETQHLERVESDSEQEGGAFLQTHLGNALVQSAIDYREGGFLGLLGEQLQQAVSGSMVGPNIWTSNQAMLRKMKGENLDPHNAHQERTRSHGRDLPKQLKSKMEAALDADFSAVRIHTDQSAHRASQAIQAHAFTVGRDIYFAQGQYSPHSVQGEKLLAHELTHVKQHQEGRIHGSGVSSPHDPLEREAYAIEAKLPQLFTQAQQEVSESVSEVSHRSTQMLREVNEVASTEKTYADIIAMNIDELYTYTEEQVDWHSKGGLKPEEVTKLRPVVEFAWSSGILNLCREHNVETIRQEIKDEEVVNALVALGMACEISSQTVHISSPPDSLQEQIQWGADIRKLEAGIPTLVLAAAVDQEEFERLFAYALVDSLVEYYKAFNPVIEHTSDIESFCILLAEEHANLADYRSLPYVRSIHRFEKACLDAALANSQDTSKSRPLILILHSTFDHNGGFHRDEYMTDVVTEPANLTILYEGASSLAEIQGEIPRIAQRWGMNDCISQVMIAGHGDANSMELTGDVDLDNSWQDESGKTHLGTRSESIDLDENGVATEELLLTIMENMDPDSSEGRIVFNACLTNSNDLSEVDLEGLSEEEQRAKLQQHLLSQGSLASTTQVLADTYGYNIESIGANASIGPVQLIDDQGNLTMVSAKDPHVTDKKRVYIEKGTEPLGVLRAVLECWAKIGPEPTFAAIQRRLGVSNASVGYGVVQGTKWNEAVIRSIFVRMLQAYQSNVGAIQKLCDSAGALGHLGSNSSAYCNPEELDNNIASADALPLCKALKTASNFRWARHSFPVLQFWLKYDTQRASTLASRMNSWNRVGICERYGAYIGDDFLRPYYGDMLPAVSAGGDPGTGALFYALIHISRKAAGAASEAKNLLYTLGETDRDFPDALQINEMLEGVTSKEAILDYIGLGTPDMEDPETDIDANTDLDGDGINETYLEPYSGSVIIRKSKATMYEKPDNRSPSVGSLSKNTEVYSIGYTGSWYAIDYNQRTVFVHDSSFEE